VVQHPVRVLERLPVGLAAHDDANKRMVVAHAGDHSHRGTENATKAQQTTDCRLRTTDVAGATEVAPYVCGLQTTSWRRTSGRPHGLRRSSFVVRRSSFVVRRSSFGVSGMRTILSQRG